MADPTVPTPFPLHLTIVDGQGWELALSKKGAAAADHLWLCVWKALELQPAFVTTLSTFYNDAQYTRSRGPPCTEEKGQKATIERAFWYAIATRIIVIPHIHYRESKAPLQAKRHYTWQKY